MDFFISILYLLGIGFAVGLTGAMIPGPLLGITVTESLRKGMVGHLIIVGHIIAESLLVVLIAFGLISFLRDFENIIYLVGGIILILMSLSMLNTYSKEEFHLHNNQDNQKYSTSKGKFGLFVHGATFSVFNPSFPLWWMTAGISLLMYGYSILNIFGLILVLVGHWVSDVSYYMLVSYLIAKGREKFIQTYAKKIALILVTFILVLGAYFVYLGLISAI